MARISAWEIADMAAPWWRCYLPLDPGAAVLFAGRRFPLLPGEGLLIAPGTHCAATAERPFRKAYIHFTWEPGGHSAGPGVHRAPGLGVGAVRALARNDGSFSARLLELLARACRIVPATTFASTPPPGPLARHAMELLDRDGRPPDNHLVAATLGVHAHSLVRLFVREVGATPQAWARERRMQRAARLLADTSDAIDTIAARCGCWDRNHFTRQFTRRWHCPPAAFRARERHDGG
jgi:AraC-like DNA-binding protein